MKTSVTNNDDKAREAEVDVLIPMDAFVMKFTMEVGDKIFEGKVEEKQKANKIFENVSKVNFFQQTVFLPLISICLCFKIYM